MPSLNRELLFDISRKLVENCEQDAVYRYGLSGKEAFDILRNVFASVKVLQLFNDHYAIGWDNHKLCRFDFNGDKPHLKLLLNGVGGSVKELHLGCQNMPMYSSVISNIIAAKNISSFTVDVKSDYIFASVLFASISNTLEEVKIPHNFLHEKFVQLPLTFDTVTILDNQMADGMVFNFKKVSLTISSDFWLWKQILIEKFIKIDAKMSSFTHLSFTSNISQSAAFADVNPLFIMKVFPSLEELQFYLKPSTKFYSHPFEGFLAKYQNAFHSSSAVPSKMIYTICGGWISVLEFLDVTYDFDEENDGGPLLKCYHKTFTFDKSHDTVFEIRIDRRR